MCSQTFLWVQRTCLVFKYFNSTVTNFNFFKSLKFTALQFTHKVRSFKLATNVMKFQLAKGNRFRQRWKIEFERFSNCGLLFSFSPRRFYNKERERNSREPAQNTMQSLCAPPPLPLSSLSRASDWFCSTRVRSHLHHLLSGGNGIPVWVEPPTPGRFGVINNIWKDSEEERERARGMRQLEGQVSSLWHTCLGRGWVAHSLALFISVSRGATDGSTRFICKFHICRVEQAACASR